jgi:UDP-N-acetylglucosamine--N-acetylmuramyl-(pentapeptide) pyrophosphoryl-undecaprenol N-acetylglucosamine transferase
LIWIGSRAGIEAQIVPTAGIAYQSISTGKLRRYWDWQNLGDLLVRVPRGFVESFRILSRLRPQLVFATGGFVALPPALAAWLLRIPVVIHEQVAAPGLANRIAARVAKKVAVSYSISIQRFPKEKCVITGNPLRPELAGGDRDRALSALGLDPSLQTLYITGGAQGSHRINRSVGRILSPLLDLAQVIHQCGNHPTTGDRAWLEKLSRELPQDRQARYQLRPYVGAELREVYAATDLVVGRAGAGTVNECAHLGKPALLIPLPGSSGNEQAENARLMAEAGAARLLQDAHLTPELLLEEIRSLLSDRSRLKEMGEKAKTLAVPDARERLVNLLLGVARGSHQLSAFS